jgi:hypothetical protein
VRINPGFLSLLFPLQLWILVVVVNAMRIRPMIRDSSAPDARKGCMEVRFIRLRDAPLYLGMDKNRFNREVRPSISVIPIGTQGIAFDRIDLDAWADDYKSRNGIPSAQPRKEKPWETKERQVSQNAVGFGISTSSSEGSAFARALKQAVSRKRSHF